MNPKPDTTHFPALRARYTAPSTVGWGLESLGAIVARAGA